MANIDAPFGLLPIRGPMELRSMYIPDDYGTALFVGDPVIVVADGSNTAVVRSGDMTHDIGTLPEIAKATAGDDNEITGVIVGFEHRAGSTGNTKHSPANTEGVAIVNVHPDTVYAVQCDDSLPASAVNAVGLLIYTHAGSTVTGKSGAEMDSTVTTNDASYQLLVVGISKDPARNDTTSANTVVEVKLNRMTGDARDKLGI